MFLKKVKDQISQPVSMISFKSLENGIVPNCIKVAKVVPIYKSKVKRQFSYYWPI